MPVQRYFNTLRYLRPVQFYGRLWFRFNKPTIDSALAPPAARSRAGVWCVPAARRASLLSLVKARFLNVARDISAPTIWNDGRCEKLWLYNLHYFDDLNAEDAIERVEWHRALIERWVAENPPGQVTGWEPYPTSLRVVNWIKWALAGNELKPKWCHSLAVQVRWLGKRLEYRLLGNHLFANAKALVFAGLFFDGLEAERWLSKGAAILAREVPEQILTDGGQFERSPMYHALALEDVLDLLNIQRAYGSSGA